MKVKLYFLPATKGDQRLAFGTVEEAFSFFEIKNIPLGNFIQQRLTRVINPVFNNVNIFLVGTCKNDNGASFDIYETRNLDLKTGRTKHTNAYDGAKIIFNDYLQNKISK